MLSLQREIRRWRVKLAFQLRFVKWAKHFRSQSTRLAKPLPSSFEAVTASTSFADGSHSATLSSSSATAPVPPATGPPCSIRIPPQRPEGPRQLSRRWSAHSDDFKFDEPPRFPYSQLVTDPEHPRMRRKGFSVKGDDLTLLSTPRPHSTSAHQADSDISVGEVSVGKSITGRELKSSLDTLQLNFKFLLRSVCPLLRMFSVRNCQWTKLHGK
jgi:hypothetical protein